MWLNEVSFCPHPQRTWQATACAVAGPGVGALDTVHGKGARTYSPSGACGCYLARTLEHKRINAGTDGMLECADGTSSGADEIFAYAYVCLPGVDVCVAGADVNESCSENSECKRARMEYKWVRVEYKQARAVS
jgi:hypothetical protein